MMQETTRAYGNTQEISEPTTIMLINELGDKTDRLEKLCTQLRSLNDVVSGTRPEKVPSGDAPEAPISSLNDNLRRRNRHFDDVIRRCEDALARIVSAIG